MILAAYLRGRLPPSYPVRPWGVLSDLRLDLMLDLVEREMAMEAAGRSLGMLMATWASGRGSRDHTLPAAVGLIEQMNYLGEHRWEVVAERLGTRAHRVLEFFQHMETSGDMTRIEKDLDAMLLGVKPFAGKGGPRG